MHKFQTSHQIRQKALAVAICVGFCLVASNQAKAQTGNDKMRALLGQLDKASSTLEIDVAMQSYWKSFGVYKARHQELVSGLQRNRMLTKDAFWRQRTKSALSAMKGDARDLTNFKTPQTTQTAPLRAQLLLISNQTQLHVANYLQLMATPNGTTVKRSLDSHNKLVEYMNAANRARRALDSSTATSQPPATPQKAKPQKVTPRKKTALTNKTNLSREIAFVKAVPEKATLAQIKRLLPRETRYGNAEWIYGEGGMGNTVEFSGPISGTLWFASAEQRRNHSSPNSFSHVYQSSDPLNWVQVWASGSRNSTNAQTKARLAQLTAFLGKPAHTKFLAESGDGPSAPGYHAQWKTSKRLIHAGPSRYFYDASRQEYTQTVLTLTRGSTR